MAPRAANQASLQRDVATPDQPSFVADDAFQDQGPGSVEIYKLDLFKERELLNPVTVQPPRTKSKLPKKGHVVSWKAKPAPKHKASTPSDKVSNFFSEPRTDVPPPPRSENFGVGGVPELQVGCEGLEATSAYKLHRKRRSIDRAAPVKGRSEPAPLAGVTPISLDLDYELSFEEAYEEMDELHRLKKLESVTKKPERKRGDMDARLQDTDQSADGRRDKLPVRGDLGNSSLADKSDSRNEATAGNTRDSADNVPVNLGRKLLTLDADKFAHGDRSRRAIWGFAEDEGVVSSDELQTENERRRQYYERNHQDWASRHREQPQNDTQRREEAQAMRQEYRRMLEEEERRRRPQQQHRWNDEQEQRREPHRSPDERYRSTVDSEQERNHRLPERDQDELGQEPLPYRKVHDHHRAPVADREHRRRPHEEELRRREEDERRRQEYEEARRRFQEELNRRVPQEEDVQQRAEGQMPEGDGLQQSVQSPERTVSEADRRRVEEERHRVEEERRRAEEERHRAEEERRRAEDRRREWLLRRQQHQQREEEERRRQRPEASNLQRPNDTRPNATEEDRRSREQIERERERKLREYIQRNRPINVRPGFHRREGSLQVRRLEEQRRRHEVRREQTRNMTDREMLEHRRRRLEEYRRRLADQHRFQEYSGRPMSNWTQDQRPHAEMHYYQNFRPEAERRSHGPNAPTGASPRSYASRRMDEDRRRQREEQLKEEMRRREQESLRAQSRRYEEDRQRQLRVQEEAERRRKELVEEQARRSQARRTWSSSYPSSAAATPNTGSKHSDHRLQEHRRRQDATFIPANLVLDEARRAAERDRQRQEQERRRTDAERFRHEEQRMKEAREREDYDRVLKEQERRQEEARLNALPVSARIVIRPGTSSSPDLFSRIGFGNDITFPDAIYNRQGGGQSRVPFGVVPTNPVQQKGPGPCVWAVVQCCPTSRSRLVRCFESLGCPGVNWDVNPCRGSITRAARDEIAKFYATGEGDM